MNTPATAWFVLRDRADRASVPWFAKQSSGRLPITDNVPEPAVQIAANWVRALCQMIWTQDPNHHGVRSEGTRGDVGTSTWAANNSECKNNLQKFTNCLQSDFSSSRVPAVQGLDGIGPFLDLVTGRARFLYGRVSSCSVCRSARCLVGTVRIVFGDAAPPCSLSIDMNRTNEEAVCTNGRRS